MEVVNNSNNNSFHNGNQTMTPSDGETILSLVLPYLGGVGQLCKLANVNKHLHVMAWRLLYHRMDQKYPLYSSTLDMPPIAELDDPNSIIPMRLPPRMIHIPGFDGSIIGRPRYIFPMPASSQPQIACDPRTTNDFQSLTWLDKTKALAEYADKVNFLYDHRVQPVVNLGRSAYRAGVETNFIGYFGWLLIRCLARYPFFFCLNESDAIQVRACFLERALYEALQVRWSIGRCQALVEALLLHMDVENFFIHYESIIQNIVRTIP